ncbi:MAG: DUF5719 family protein [Nocardioides sp.]|uniref:DUF5719 family protein n=1 Tax=Nocardioides sp. TaxID=35761 RepID=UPI0039E38C0E
MSRAASRVGGRARRRIDVTVILAVALPLLLGLALALTRPHAARTVPAAASEAPLTSASVVCPGSIDDTTAASTLTIGSAAGGGATGSATVRTGTSSRTVDLRDGRSSDSAGSSAPTVVTGTGAVAPGLLAALASASPLTAWDCTVPVGDQWFTGVGAGPTQASVVELVNPNTGLAVVDIDVLSDEGLLDVPQLRGVSVPAGEDTRLDLGELVPRTGVMALHVSVVRGQLGVAVRDRGERLVGGVSTEDWLAPQPSPSRRSLMLGLQPGSGRHTLTIANDGDSQVAADLKLVTADSTFAPDGLDPIQVPPHSVVETVLDDTLAGSVATGAVGLEVEADGPVTTSLRSVVHGDLSFLVPGEPVAGDTTLLVPGGGQDGEKTSARLLLGGASAVGVATVTARDARGATLLTERISLGPDKAPSLDLPSGATSVEVVPSRTSVQGAILVTGPDAGSAVVRLRELERTGSVPHISFGP